LFVTRVTNTNTFGDLSLPENRLKTPGKCYSVVGWNITVDWIRGERSWILLVLVVPEW